MHPYAEKIAEIGAKANPTFQLIGIEPVSFGNSQAVLKMKVTEHHHNGAGVLQGGFYTILGDEAIALAIHGELDAGTDAATITETTEFLKGVKEGEVFAIAKIVKKGRRIIFAEAEVHAGSPDGALLSKTTASYIVVTSNPS